MISKQIFEETFSLTTAQALQQWADINLMAPDFGDYAMRIDANATGETFAEIEMIGLATDTEATVRMYFEDIVSNNFSIRLNTIANDNTSTQVEYGWGEGQREFTFTPSASTMYLAIGDNLGSIGGTYSIVDNVSVKQGTTEFISNGTFEGNVITPWYGQNSSATLSVYDYVSTPTPPGDNPYLEAVNIPAFDSSNVAHVRIPTDAPMSDATFNNLSYTNFYIEPANYGTQVITLTTSGTTNNRRTISLYNGNDDHPAKLTTAELSNYQLLLNGADYWTIDRWCGWNNGNYMIELRESSHNIFNRMWSDNVGSTVIIKNLSHNNTFQNSRLDNQSDPGYDGSVQIQIAPWGVNYGQIHNTKVINNEFYNANDGFQIVRTAVSDYQTPYQDINAEGTIIDSNSFYKDVPYMENAIDLKAGSDNANNPVIISNNQIWGYFEHQDYVPGEGDDNYPPGYSAIIAHYNPTNIHMYKNIIYNSGAAINAGSNGPASGFDKSFVDSKINNNIIYNCALGKGGTPSTSELNTPIRLSSHVDTDSSNNYIISGAGAKDALVYTYADIGTSIMDTTRVVNPGTDIKADWFIKHQDGSVSSAYEASLLTAYEMDNTAWGDYSYTWGKFGNSPEVITLSNILDPAGTIVSPLGV